MEQRSPVQTAPSAPDVRATVNGMRAVVRQLTRSPVSFVDAGFPLGDVQEQLEMSLGVPLTLTAGASSVRYRGKITGATGMDFIESFAAKLNLEWAIGPNSVYLSPIGATQSTQFGIPSADVGYRAVDLARTEFEGMGSNIRVLLKQDAISVTGIPLWMEEVATPLMPALLAMVPGPADAGAVDTPLTPGNYPLDTARLSPFAAEEPLRVMVFRLNNAYVDDKQITVGSSTTLFAGVLSLFEQFTGLGSGGVVPASVEPAADSRASRVPRMDPLAGERRLVIEDTRYPAPAPSPSRQAASGPINGPVVIGDSRTNSLIVRDKASMFGQYSELIKILDQPAEMIQLDAFVIDIKASRFNEFGIGLSWTNSQWNSPNFAPGGSVPADANLILQATQGAQLLAQVRALETEGESQVLTVPSVVTQNNLEASFSARENFYVKVSGNLDASLTEVTAETLLRVTPLVEQNDVSAAPAADPQIAQNRRIRLLINIQDGSVDSRDSAVVDELPRTLENQINTQAVVRGGETLVIGGQVVRKETSNESGIPIIRSLPILGALTNSRVKRAEEFVRIYVVRPRILIDSPGSSLVSSVSQSGETVDLTDADSTATPDESITTPDPDAAAAQQTQEGESMRASMETSLHETLQDLPKLDDMGEIEVESHIEQQADFEEGLLDALDEQE